MSCSWTDHKAGLFLGLAAAKTQYIVLSGPFTILLTPNNEQGPPFIRESHGRSSPSRHRNMRLVSCFFYLDNALPGVQKPPVNGAFSRVFPGRGTWYNLTARSVFYTDQYKSQVLRTQKQYIVYIGSHGTIYGVDLVSKVSVNNAISPLCTDFQKVLYKPRHASYNDSLLEGRAPRKERLTGLTN